MEYVDTALHESGKVFPKTRYQGSKRKIAAWIMSHLRDLDYANVLDAFGGTGTMSYCFKAAGKNVVFNDTLKFNQISAQALVVNQNQKISNGTLEKVLSARPRAGFISETFHGIYYTADENMWLDGVIAEISAIANEFERSIAYWCLFQSCIIKRPYNLFHRANLQIRLVDIGRSFGNKKTWDTPFEVHFRKFAEEANNAVFAGKGRCEATNCDALDVAGDFDLVYLDPPYIGASGTCDSYSRHYHFLEGLARYSSWSELIDTVPKHRPMKKTDNPWEDKKRVEEALGAIIERHPKAHFVISYRSNGYPPLEQFALLLQKAGMVTSMHSAPYKYALSKSSDTKEVLIVGRRV